MRVQTLTIGVAPGGELPKKGYRMQTRSFLTDAIYEVTVKSIESIRWKMVDEQVVELLVEVKVSRKKVKDSAGTES